MKLARHDLVAALQLRYDHYSSRSMFEAACTRANLGDQEHYSVAEVGAFRAALATLGDRLGRVDQRLDSLLGRADEAPAKPAQVPQTVVPEPVAPAPPPPTASPAPAAPPTTAIVLLGVELADGEALFVCGDRAELGNWDPDRARPMRRDGDAWRAVVTPGEGSFKFLRRSEDGQVTWEGGDNRELGMAREIETSWQP